MKIDNSWSLFLDRDGDINQRIIDDYVKNWGEFVFMPHAIETIAHFRQLFKYIFVVTNQQGIGKGIMSEQDLTSIHQKMQGELSIQNEANLPIINRILHCPSLKSENDINRKPQIGMALQAKSIFQDVDFQKSIMIGDSISDMEFGRKAGMTTIFFGKEITTSPAQNKWIDFECTDWQEVRKLIRIT